MSPDDAPQALADMAGAPAVYEGFIDFSIEVSVIGTRGADGSADEGGGFEGARFVDSYPTGVSWAPTSPEACEGVSSLGLLCAAAPLSLAAGRFSEGVFFLGSGFGSVDADSSSSRRLCAANGSSELGWLDACLAFLFSASRRFFSASRASISFARSNAVMGFSSSPPGASLDAPAPAAEDEATAAVLPGSPTRFAPGGAGPAATPALCFRSSSYFFSSAISASDFATSLILGGMPARERVRWRHANWGNARQISIVGTPKIHAVSGSPEKRVDARVRQHNETARGAL